MKKSLNFELAKEYYQKALQENTNIKDITSQASDLLNFIRIIPYCQRHRQHQSMYNQFVKM